MNTLERLWYKVDGYFADHLRPPDPILTAAMRDGAALPQIQVSELLGGFLSVLARTAGARRVLEVGTLFGYSTIHLARAAGEDGVTVSLEYSPEHAAVARGNIERAGLSDRVEILEGPAVESLPTLIGGDPFDLVFIDADKENNPTYLDWALRLTRPGSVIVVDNVVRAGAVAEADSDRPDVEGTRTMVEAIGTAVREGTLEATAMQSVGAKGYDGFLLAYVL